MMKNTADSHCIELLEQIRRVKWSTCQAVIYYFMAEFMICFGLIDTKFLGCLIYGELPSSTKSGQQIARELDSQCVFGIPRYLSIFWLVKTGSKIDARKSKMFSNAFWMLLHGFRWIGLHRNDDQIFYEKEIIFRSQCSVTYWFFFVKIRETFSCLH